ncbi:MAG TPA: hypothetical protein VLL54_19915 [Pyrinomonadaceae bacterium]|nr:hypothetical protein [Pyrinomonadaceae bacterium]
MKKVLILILFLAPSLYAQQRTFNLEGASKYFAIKIVVSKCDDDSCSGKATFSFHKKGDAKPYQVISLPDTYVDISEGQPAVNETLLYDKQSVLTIDDFNFDGMEDVAICDGQNGSYGMPSFNVYLSSRAAGKFIYNRAFSELAHHLGMFEVDKKAKTLKTFDKSGCCYHITERYEVVNNRPVKVFVFEEDATRLGKYEGKVILTTKKFAGGRWTTTVKVEDSDKYYGNQPD